MTRGIKILLIVGAVIVIFLFSMYRFFKGTYNNFVIKPVCGLIKCGIFGKCQLITYNI